MSYLREINDAAVRALLGNMVYGRAGLAIGSTPQQISTANAFAYAIDGVFYNRTAVATTALTAHPVSGVTGAFAPHAQFESRYYAVLIDASGNITTKQGAANGPIPFPGAGFESNLVSGFGGGSPNNPAYAVGQGTVTGITAAFPAVVTTGANHNRQTGDTVRLDGIPTQVAMGTQMPMSTLNGRAYKVKRLTATTFSLFTLDGDPVDTRALAPFGAGTGNWVEEDIARACLGAVLITPTAGAFVPGTTSLSGIATYFDTPFVPLLKMP